MTNQSNQQPIESKSRASSQLKRKGVLGKTAMQESLAQNLLDTTASASQTLDIKQINNTVEEPKPSQTALEFGVRFLLADFENSREFRQHTIAFIDRRINAMLTLTYAVVAGLVLIASHLSPRDFLFLSLIGSLSLSGIGLSTFRLVIQRDITVVDYTRAINLIRKYFATEAAPHIREYLRLSISENHPKYNSLANHPQIVIVINSLSFAVTITILKMLLMQVDLLDFVTVLIGGLTFSVAYTLQMIYARTFYRSADTNKPPA